MPFISKREIIRNAYVEGGKSSGGMSEVSWPEADQHLGAGLPRRIRAIRERLGLTKTGLAERIGVSQPTVTRWESNQDVPAERHLQTLAAMIGISVPELRYGCAGLSEPVPVVGYVGPEAVVVPLRPERRESELEQVATLPGLDDRHVLALRVRGNDAAPILRDGWLVFYQRPDGGIPDNCVGQICVIGLADGRLLLRELRLAEGGPSGVERRFDLHGWDGKSERLASQAVGWAARVVGFRAP
jgi:transcriptional regulator with XRE-family HTH domain